MPSKPASGARPKIRKIVLVVFEQTKSLDVVGPLQVFHDARLEDGSPAYEVVVASATGGPVPTDAGVTLASERIDEVMAGTVDTLLIAGAPPVVSTASTAPVRESLRPFLKRPKRIAAICMGAFVLAELGLLDRREATTHWAACGRLQREYPAVVVRPDAIFVTSGKVWTSAGVSAGIDLALAMVEADLGHAPALFLARALVLFLKRPGGQSQFSVELERQTNDAHGRFDALHAWIRENMDGDLSVPALAARAGMSPRNFARVYPRETGESPAQAVERLRVEAARRLLETASDSVQEIALRVGFGDDERMRRAFLKAYGVPPHAYRSRFGSADLVV